MQGETQQQTVKDRNANNFTYHKPTPEMVPVFQAIRTKARELADYIADHVPAGREQATALTKLEEFTFWANAGIARTGEPDRGN